MEINGLPQDNNVDFRHLLNSFWEYRRLILTVCLITLLASFLFTFSKAPLYDANILLQIESKSHMGASIGGISQLMGAGGEANPTATQKELIRSRVILEPVVKQLGLDTTITVHHVPVFGKLFSHANKSVIKLSHFSALTSYDNKPLQLLMTDATHYNLLDQNDHLLLQGELDKLVTSNDHRFTLQVTGEHIIPGTTYDIVKHPDTNIVNGLRPQLIIEELGTDGTPTGLLQVSMQGTDPVLISNILNTIASTTTKINSVTKSQELSKTIEFLTHQIPLARNSLGDAENTLNQYRAKSGKIDIRFETQQLLLQFSSLQKQILQMNLAKVNSLETLTPQHPYIIQLTEKIKQLQSEKDKLENELRLLPASDQVAINLMRDVKVKNEIYLILLSKIQELQVEKAGAASDVHVLATATPPDVPLPKHSGIIMAASFLLGLFLSCIFVIAKKALFHRVNDPRWIEQHLQITNLAVIPYSKPQVTHMERYKQHGDKLPVLAANKPNDLSIEALRSLRTSLQLMLCETTNKIVTILGVSPGIGKSFISINLAYLLADIGKKVLLIDGDIRKGCLNKYLNIKRTPGLSEVLTGNTTPDQAIHTIFPNLSFISCGNYPQSPSELLVSQQFKNLLNTFSSQFDIVLIDTAPVLAVTDSTLIASHAGTNFLVVGSDMHTVDEITTAVKRTANAGIKLNGTIFNNLKKTTVTHGNYHYHYQEETA